MEDNYLIAFKKIANFVKDLNSVFEDKQKSLALYNRLIEKTTISHENAVKKHVDCFTDFCQKNREAIISQDNNKIVEPIIKYSDKVFIDIKNLIAISDKETIDAIWNHLLIISNVVDPSGGALLILKERLSKSSTPENKEEEFITNLISKVESVVDPEKIENPMEAITSIMSSGLITDIIGGVQKGINEGSLDIGKLMGTMTGLLNKNGIDPKGGSAGGLPIDINMITNMVGSMMGGMGGSGGLDINNLIAKK